jgi:hypothetical protein
MAGFVKMSAFGFLALGGAWLYTFLFTNHRPHHAGVMIPVGMLMVLFAWGIFFLKRWCIVGALLMASFVFLSAAGFQWSAGQIHPFFLASSLVSALYMVMLALFLYRSRGERIANFVH